MSLRRRQLLCLGDSNTHGTAPVVAMEGRRRLRGRDRWPGVLAEALGSHWRVIEEGQPGRTTVHDDPVEGAHKNALRVLPALLETHRPLDLAIIMLGTNDLKARFGMTPSDIAQSVGRLAERVAASRTGPDASAPAVLLVAPPPILERGALAETFAGGAAKSEQLAARLGDVADRLGTGFLDAGRHAQVDPLDGVHMTRDSHRALGQAIARYLNAILNDAAAE